MRSKDWIMRVYNNEVIMALSSPFCILNSTESILLCRLYRIYIPLKCRWETSYLKLSYFKTNKRKLKTSRNANILTLFNWLVANAERGMDKLDEVGCLIINVIGFPKLLSAPPAPPLSKLFFSKIWVSINNHCKHYT